MLFWCWDVVTLLLHATFIAEMMIISSMCAVISLVVVADDDSYDDSDAI